MDFKKKLPFMLLMLSTGFLTGCISYVFSGAGLFYDRHTLYKKLSDFQLNAKISRELYKDEVFKCPYCSIDLAVFKGDVLLSGHVPTEALRQEANIRVTSIHGYRRFFDQLALRQSKGMSLQDDWITTAIRSQILADSSINLEKDCFESIGGGLNSNMLHFKSQKYSINQILLKNN